MSRIKNELEIKQVPFMGSELMAARDDNGEIWAGVSWMCNGIGLSKSQKDTQIQNVQKDTVLREGCLKLQAGVFDPNNDTIALKLDYVPLWLAKISITPAMQEETPELAEKLKQYQLKAKDVLAAAFLPSNVKHKPRKTEAYSLQSVNNAAKIISSALEKAGVSSSSIAFSLKRLYQKAEIDIELDSVKAEKPYYLKEAIAKRLGVCSKNGLPHASAIGAIIERIDISDDEKQLTLFERNGHEDHVWKYSEPVIARVSGWLIQHNYPFDIESTGGKIFHVKYVESPNYTSKSR